MSKPYPSRTERRLEAARGYLMLDMSDQALRELNEIPSNDPEIAERHRLCAQAFQKKKDFHAALDAFDEVLLEHPDDLSVLLGMAWCYKRTEQLQRAIAAVEEAYRWFPNEPIVLYNLSCYLALAGNKDRALSWLGRSLRLDARLKDLIAEEKDFDDLRDDPDFRLIIDPLNESE